MALAGSLGAKEDFAAQRRDFPGCPACTFVVLLLGTVLLVGALNFLPALTLGPIVEHFLTAQGKLY